MSVQSHFGRTMVAVAAALAMSSVTVGAAIGPAQANAGTLSSGLLVKGPINA